MDDVAVDVDEAEIAAVVAVGEPFVVQAQEVEDGGVKIVMRDSVLDGVHAQFVGGAVGDPPFDASARHPHGEAVMVMAAADGGLRQRPVRLLEQRVQDRVGDCPLLARPLRSSAFSRRTRSGGQDLGPYKCRAGNIRSCNIRITAIP